MKSIEKRDGSVVEFDSSKISAAIAKAFLATNEINPDDAGIASLGVAAETMLLLKNEKDPIAIELIQDAVEKALMQLDYTKTAKAYMLYRKNRENTRNARSAVLSYKNLVNGYVKNEDWRIKENSTVTYSIGGLILSNSGAITANYWLSEIYDEEMAEAHKTGDMHIHDLSMLTGYCSGWSLDQLIKIGISGVSGRITSAPAVHLSTLCNQMVNFLGILQNEWAGAQAFSSFDTYLAPFVKADNLTYKQTKQCIQSFVYGINTPSRWGTQAPFTNITLDWDVPEDLAELPAIVGGKKQKFRYKDCKPEMDMINKAFIEIMLEGDANRRGFQYPIPTYSITKNFDWGETENNKLLFEMTTKYGTPYFSNYINSDMKPTDVRSMCCRLRLDLRELRKKSGGLFGSGENTGSIGVVTLNMPRLAYLSKDENDFNQKLDYLVGIASRSLKIKRDVLTKLMDEGLYPYTEAYLNNLDNHFSTIGIVGMNEACLNAKWLQKDLTHEASRNFTQRTLSRIKENLSDYQEMYGDLYNLEATPAEGSSYRLAKEDKKRYPDIITAGNNDTPYYTNSSNFPVGFTEDLFLALKLQDPLQTEYTSGTVFHVFLGEKLSNWKATAALVRKIAENYNLPYYTISPTYSICPNDGYIAGEHKNCPKCRQICEVYSRISGYYRPVQNWNAGKTQEFSERVTYKPVFKSRKALPASSISKKPAPIQKIPNPVTSNSTLLLFTSKTCPKCLEAKKWLKSANIAYSEMDAIEQLDTARKLGIRQAPTLAIKTNNNWITYAGLSKMQEAIKTIAAS